MTPPVPPENDIGPLYKIFGGILAFGALVLFYIKTGQGRDLSMVDLFMFLIIVLFVLALWRPDKFDAAMKALADRLPFLSYKKD